MMLLLPSFVWDVSPILTKSPGLEIRWYSLCAQLAMVLGAVLFARQLTRGGGMLEEVGDFMAYAFPGVLLGARLAHALFYDFDRVLEDPLWVLRFWTGGMASHGALIGLWLAMFLFTRRRAIAFLDGSDRLAFSVALASVLFRIGNLFNSEIVGKIVPDQSWGMRFPWYDRGGLAPLRYPTQCFEMLLGVAVLALLVACDRFWGRERRPRGALTGVLLIGYFGARFVLEFWKEPEGIDRASLLNVGQLLSIPFVIAGCVVLWCSLARRRSAGWFVGSARGRGVQGVVQEGVVGE